MRADVTAVTRAQDLRARYGCTHNVLTHTEFHPIQAVNYYSVIGIAGEFRPGLCIEKFVFRKDIGSSHSVLSVCSSREPLSRLRA